MDVRDAIDQGNLSVLQALLAENPARLCDLPVPVP